tara:strand:- start:451 stop:1254 length:804 start_codon:yes stop_codon:yes gene_type:complete
MIIEYTRLTEHIAAEVVGLDLASGAESIDGEALRSLLAEHAVLVIRDQHLSPPQLLDAVGLLGIPERQNYSQFNHPEYPDIGILDYEGEQKPADMWHTDHTNRECPPNATILYALKVPSRGGDTSFVNMNAAFLALPGEVKRELEGMKTVNTFDGQFEVRAADQRDFGRQVEHPLVRTHPETGRKALYFHVLKASYVVGKTAAESRLFLNELLEASIRSEFMYRHQWRPGDLVVVDNRTAMHKVHDDYDRTEKRLLHRVILKGDRPV